MSPKVETAPQKGQIVICAMCRKEFECAWTAEEAEQEYRKNFGREIEQEPTNIVCDDCYKKIMGA